jgi:NAD(P)-dependent dehydrogenase (short-subunit alcohol dehydrogenase family)
MSRNAHANPHGPRDARPTALQIVQDEKLENKLTGKVMVITGVTSGIGLETARALAATGATLFLTVRDLEKAKTTLHDLLKSDRVFLIRMDNSSLASIKAAAADMLAKSNTQVNILINNAGIMGVPSLQLTDDGFEAQFATNYLGHFLLFELLKPALIASATPEFSSRVVNVSSSASRSVDLTTSDNYNFEKGNYDPGVAYAQSKLAVVWMANEIERRYGHKGLHATSLHPGGVATNISRNVSPEVVAAIVEKLKSSANALKTAEQGAATTVVAAIGKEWENKGGKYLEDCAESQRGPDDYDGFGVGWVRQTYNVDNEARLWKDSLKMLGLKDDL